jgi:hypothetical protein
MKTELDYSIDIKYIDGDAELENLYGEQVPVTQIDGEHHDFWRVDPAVEVHWMFAMVFVFILSVWFVFEAAKRIPVNPPAVVPET